MKRLLLAATAALSLAGCNTANPTLEEIQAATVIACNFVPTAFTVASVIPQTAAFAVPANAIATAICAAVTAQKGGVRRGMNRQITVTVSVNGVKAKVTGHFQ